MHLRVGSHLMISLCSYQSVQYRSCMLRLVFIWHLQFITNLASQNIMSEGFIFDHQGVVEAV